MLYPFIITINNDEIIYKDINEIYNISEFNQKIYNIELFKELSGTFCKLNNKFKQYYPEKYNLELKLSALFLNIKKINNLINIEENNNKYKKWYDNNFEFIKNNIKNV